MTALDPAPIVAELREQWDTRRGQFDPETVWRLIHATEGTGELPLASVVPLRRRASDSGSAS